MRLLLWPDSNWFFTTLLHASPADNKMPCHMGLRSSTCELCTVAQASQPLRPCSCFYHCHARHSGKLSGGERQVCQVLPHQSSCSCHVCWYVQKERMSLQLIQEIALIYCKGPFLSGDPRCSKVAQTTHVLPPVK
jgi:hypothetical protein